MPESTNYIGKHFTHRITIARYSAPLEDSQFRAIEYSLECLDCQEVIESSEVEEMEVFDA